MYDVTFESQILDVFVIERRPAWRAMTCKDEIGRRGTRMKRSWTDKK
jgi:hypothetical protein